MPQLPMIIVHGGAGSWADDRIPVGVKLVENAARTGFQVLETGASAVDAAETCTMYMESCGGLNAGKGARPNQDGLLELDAMIVDGKNLQFGSVAAIIGIQNPISLARYVMEKTEYNFFAGENAKRVYETMIKQGYRKELDRGAVQPPKISPDGDTVGCVVVDAKGNIAATSSTGGIAKKIPGRVGDSPVIGAGAYANELCGAAATGYGEHIMRVVLSRMTVLYVEDGLDTQSAAQKGIDMFESKTGSQAGIIVADKDGNFGFATNAKAMPITVISGELENIETHACLK